MTFHVELNQGTMTIVKADRFTEGPNGVTFTEWGSRSGATGNFEVAWYPSAQVHSIKLVDER